MRFGTFLSQESSKLAKLPSDTTHYLIPFTDVAAKFMEVIEFEEISGVIFPQTAVNQIQQSSLKHYRYTVQVYNVHCTLYIPGSNGIFMLLTTIVHCTLYSTTVVLPGAFAVISEILQTVQSSSQMSSSR